MTPPRIPLCHGHHRALPRETSGLGPPMAPATPARAVPAFGFSSLAVPLEGTQGSEDRSRAEGRFSPRPPVPVVAERRQAVKAFPVC